MPVPGHRRRYVGALAILLLALALLSRWRSADPAPPGPASPDGPTTGSTEPSLTTPLRETTEPAAPRRAVPEVRVHVRTRWGPAPPDGGLVRIEAREDARAGAEVARSTCPLPGDVRFDASGWEGDVRLRAVCEWGFLEQGPVLSPPYPDEVELVLEPRGKLVVEVGELSEPRAELSVLRDGDEDLGEAKGEGRWRLVSGPLRLEFPRLVPGAYRVQLLAPPGADAPAPRGQVWVELAAGETRTVAVPDAALPAVHVTGVLSWPGGPLADHVVTLVVQGTGHHDETTTDGEGRFELDVVGAGPAELFVRGPRRAATTIETRVPVTLPAAADHVLDVVLPGGGIEGRVLLPEGVALAMPDRAVAVAPAEGGPWDRPGGEWTSLPLDDGGGYRLIGVTPGEYRIRLVGPNAYLGQSGPGIATAGSCLVRVAQGVARAPDIVVRAPVRVTGHLVRADLEGAPPPPGPVSVLVREEGAADWRLLARSAGDGSWEAYLAPGRYHVAARAGHPFPLATPGAESWTVVEGAPPLSSTLVSATARARVRLIEPRAGRALRFTIDVRGPSGEPALPQGVWRTWRREHRTGWLVPGSYVVRFQPERGAAFERTLELVGGEELALDELLD